MKKFFALIIIYLCIIFNLLSQNIRYLSVSYGNIFSENDECLNTIIIDSSNIAFIENAKKEVLMQNNIDSIKSFILNLNKKTILNYLEIADSISNKYNDLKSNDSAYFFYNKSFVFSIRCSDGSINNVLIDNAFSINRNNLNEQEIFINTINYLFDISYPKRYRLKNGIKLFKN